MKLDAKCTGHFQHSGETWISAGAEGSIQTLATEAGILGDLTHAFCASDIAERLRDACRIVRRFVQPGVKVRGHLLGRAEVFSYVIWRSTSFLGLARSGSWHGALLLEVLRQLDG